ncbi:shikimate kinase [Deinococcus reticulitermitis]|uniref:Shikimate kinase n=1 Tax=Deinococcus reticulitermitis TaxID=856736 RepID=A0A1H6VKU1_9DEIO|nr:AAA family ATPase [Deinococcus reticulitermitis]SEJ05238.1 shikimate kinase [Deinococcus reticulitermitis]
MKRVLITGMSGTGKSTVLRLLGERGFDTVSTDDGWCEWQTSPGETEPGWIWHEDRMRALLRAPRDRPLFVDGTVSNQGKFYPLFDHVVLLSAPAQTILERVRTRTTNPYGKTAAEQSEILHYLQTVEPLIRRGLRPSTDMEIRTAEMSAEQVGDQLAALAQSATTSPT